jgi:hypothetical protein
MVMDDPFRSAQFLFLLGGLLVVAGGRLTLSPGSLLLLVHLLSMPLSTLGVLLGQGAVLGFLAAMRIDRLPQLLSLRHVSVRLLTVPRRFGSKPLSQDSLPLRPATHVGKQGHQCGHGDYDYGDNENR